MDRFSRILAACALFVTLPIPARAQTGPRERLVVSTEWLTAHRQDRGLVLLHVGSADDYAKEHIPGAVYVDLHDGFSSGASHGDSGLVLELPDPSLLQSTLRRMGVADAGTIVVYWGSEWVTPTTRVLFTLQWAGLGNRTVLLDGGLGAWTAAGGAVTADVPTPPLGNVTVRPQADLVVDAAWVQAHAAASGYRVLDARAAAFYDGVREDRGKAGHIPGAGSLPWTQLMTDDVRLKSADELRALFDAAGVKAGDTVVAYCHIGQYATAVLFAARTLGHHVMLYDGAFQDWAARGLPVEGSD